SKVINKRGVSSNFGHCAHKNAPHLSVVHVWLRLMEFSSVHSVQSIPRGLPYRKASPPLNLGWRISLSSPPQFGDCILRINVPGFSKLTKCGLPARDLRITRNLSAL